MLLSLFADVRSDRAANPKRPDARRDETHDGEHGEGRLSGCCALRWDKVLASVPMTIGH